VYEADAASVWGLKLLVMCVLDGTTSDNLDRLSA
jgi:hypothetical protein